MEPVSATHEPVMVDEVLEHLEPSRGGLFVDCTVGLGGHATRVLEAGATRLVGFDRDEAALALLIMIGAVVYGAAVFALFGLRGLKALIRG